MSPLGSNLNCYTAPGKALVSRYLFATKIKEFLWEKKTAKMTYLKVHRGRDDIIFAMVPWEIQRTKVDRPLCHFN